LSGLKSMLTAIVSGEVIDQSQPDCALSVADSI